ncbi:MAG: nucleotidyl transferase AbiEii/AbiGii toxin family protein [Candidatus Gracilibacteria bacterium]|jgi:predicted nucleotidyltransferase component of viral defense system
MLLPHRQDTVHKAWLLRLLTAISEDTLLSEKFGFKGGTCAAMRGLSNRFSVDLDFDLLAEEKEMPNIRKALEKIFAMLGLEIKDQSAKVPQYFLKYQTGDLSKSNTGRNTIKLDVSFPAPSTNDYEMIPLPEIDRVVKCQTLETLVANKLVALIARYERTGKLAGRDVFDVHQFLLNGYAYKAEVILQQRAESLQDFFQKLIDFVEKTVTNTLVDQDLNLLLPEDDFQKIRKILKQETLNLLKEELKRVRE